MKENIKIISLIIITMSVVFIAIMIYKNRATKLEKNTQEEITQEEITQEEITKQEMVEDNIIMRFETNLDEIKQTELIKQIREINGVKNCQYKDSKQIWNDFQKEYFAEFPELAEGFRADNYKEISEIIITVEKNEKQNIKEDLKKIPDDIVYTLLQ